MRPAQPLTIVVEQEDDGYVASCPELDIVSQGASMEEARANLTEALTLFLETAAPAEVAKRRCLARIRTAPDWGTAGRIGWTREDLHER
jgi:predicted RNase H-like HicB family nuclease